MKQNLLVLLGLFTIITFAQTIPEDVKPPSWVLNKSSNLEAFVLPTFNVEKLKKEDKINDKNKSKPWRFGHEIYVDHNFNEVGEWTILENGDRIWRMAYKSNGAHTLNFMFDVFKLPVGSKLYVYNDSKTDLLRPFTHYNNNDEEVLGTWLVQGDKAWIEYYEPANVKESAKLTVGSVVHGYRTAETYQKTLNSSGDCNQDVDCDITPAVDTYGLDTVKENVKKAAGMLVTGASGFCSGTLVNNTNNDGTPYFMTANHCGNNVAGWAFRFNWRSPNPSCSTTTASTDGSFNQTVSGAVLRANSSQSDMELVEITDTSFFNNNPDVVWAGWNRSTSYVPMVNFGIHHPSGDIQKVCREDDGAYRASVSFNGNANTQMWYIDDWELGVTEPGSSGSGLFNETGHLIGMLSGGAAACNGTNNNGAFDYYGRFDVAWNFGSTAATRLQDWLDPAGTNAEVLEQFPILETYDNDARADIGSVSNTILCNSDFAPQIILKNPGNLTLTSATVVYSLDSQTDTTINWTGSIAPSGSEVVATPVYSNLSSGNHMFNIMVSNPNGVTDENTSNDNFTYSFNVAREYSTSEIILNLTTDDYASETSWEFRDASGALIEFGPASAYTDNTTYQETITIPNFDDCYTFILLDSFGDGICCSFGIGSYNLQDENGTIIKSGGEFGSSESVLFKILDPLSIHDDTLNELIQFYPNPVNDILTIESSVISDKLNYQIINTMGQLISNGRLNSTGLTTINMSSYTAGIYFIELKTESAKMVKKLIIK